MQISDTFPEKCDQELSGEKCLRVDRYECSGSLDRDFPVFYKGVSSYRKVGRAMTECAASLSHIQEHVYKLDGVPGCRAETQLDGTSECIIYAQLLLMNSFSGVYTDAFLEQRREEFLSGN